MRPDPKVIDGDAFEELIGMDDEGDNSFSFSIVQEFLKQGRETIKSIKENLYEKIVFFIWNIMENIENQATKTLTQYPNSLISLKGQRQLLGLCLFQRDRVRCSILLLSRINRRG